jgi:hypothetical protein
MVPPCCCTIRSDGSSPSCDSSFYAAVDDTSQVAAGGGLDQEGEDIEIVEMSEQEVWRALDEHHIIDAKTLVGLMWLRQQRILPDDLAICPDVNAKE